MGKNAKFSHYIPSKGGINCSGDCATTASGELVKNWLYKKGSKGNGVACAPTLGFWTRVRLKNLGEFTCIDSGCGIVDTGTALWFDILVEDGDQGGLPGWSTEDSDWEILEYHAHNPSYPPLWSKKCQNIPATFPPSGWSFSAEGNADSSLANTSAANYHDSSAPSPQSYQGTSVPNSQTRPIAQSSGTCNQDPRWTHCCGPGQIWSCYGRETAPEPICLPDTTRTCR